MKKIWEPNITVRDGVFGPSHGAQIILQCIAENRDILKDKSVLDIGCGSGILGVFSGEFGAKKICASDIDERAVENTRLNAKNNGIEIDARCGNYGEPFGKEKFDVVIANLPQEKFTGFANMRGNESILAFLTQAERYINPNGTLILAINGCTPYKETMQEIQRNWKIKKAKGSWVKIKGWVQENIHLFLNKKEATLREKKGDHETPIFYLILEKKAN